MFNELSAVPAPFPDQASNYARRAQRLWVGANSRSCRILHPILSRLRLLVQSASGVTSPGLPNSLRLPVQAQVEHLFSGPPIPSFPWFSHLIYWRLPLSEGQAELRTGQGQYRRVVDRLVASPCLGNAASIRDSVVSRWEGDFEHGTSSAVQASP